MQRKKRRTGEKDRGESKLLARFSDIIATILECRSCGSLSQNMLDSDLQCFESLVWKVFTHDHGFPTGGEFRIIRRKVIHLLKNYAPFCTDERDVPKTFFFKNTGFCSRNSIYFSLQLLCCGYLKASHIKSG